MGTDGVDVLNTDPEEGLRIDGVDVLNAEPVDELLENSPVLTVGAERTLLVAGAAGLIESAISPPMLLSAGVPTSNFATDDDDCSIIDGVVVAAAAAPVLAGVSGSASFIWEPKLVKAVAGAATLTGVSDSA